jgi:3-dehydroquinate dehydratase-2
MPPARLKILVLHGPNLNLLGRREPHIYGSTTLADVDQRLHALATELDVEIETFQSNHEGELIDRLQQRIDGVQGCVINAAGLTHTSVALHDCIKAMPFPVVEVHLSNPQAREDFRRRSLTGEAARGAVMGFGWRSYTAALRGLVELLREQP